MALKDGRIIRFDMQKGFGFITPDDGGDDVFLHLSSVVGDPNRLRPGLRVAFEDVLSDQGRKALTARPAEELRPVVAPHADTDLCEVISEPEFLLEVTDVLLDAAPALTGTQILEIRSRLAACARTRRWLDS